MEIVFASLSSLVFFFFNLNLITLSRFVKSASAESDGVVDAIKALTEAIQERLPPSEKKMSKFGKQSSFPATKCLVQY